ncbi:MAG: hypothetical protein JWQ40_1842 [Segetibacter sp.]|jgi:hypothetical protein|nr:hypothetical protein [Segetibacter sp.]
MAVPNLNTAIITITSPIKINLALSNLFQREAQKASFCLRAIHGNCMSALAELSVEKPEPPNKSNSYQHSPNIHQTFIYNLPSSLLS